MKKVIKHTLTALGGVAGARLNASVSLPLLNRGLNAVGLGSKIPAWAGGVIADLSLVAHVVGGLALGHKAGSLLTSKLG